MNDVTDKHNDLNDMPGKGVFDKDEQEGPKVPSPPAGPGPNNAPWAPAVPGSPVGPKRKMGISGAFRRLVRKIAGKGRVPHFSPHPPTPPAPPVPPSKPKRRKDRSGAFRRLVRKIAGKGRVPHFSPHPPTPPAPPVPPSKPKRRKDRSGAFRRLVRKIAGKKRLLAAIVVAAAIIITIGYGLMHDYLMRQEQTMEEAAATTAPPVIATPVLNEKNIIVPSGSTLASLLKREGFSAREVHTLREAVKNVYDLSRIRAGHAMRITRMPGEPWRSIEYDVDELRYIKIINGGKGIEASIKTYPFEVKTAVISGTVEDSLIGAVNKAGEDDSLAIELAERCFGWEIDFYSDLRQGDSFTIYFEKKYISGEFAGYRNILAAEFINDGKVHRAFRYTYPDNGDSDFFDEEGGSKRREFLRSPFKFTARITSRFTSRRFHPIKKIFRSHYGVDYAASIGTPVQATADGRVTSAGWNGEAGRMVKLEHKNHYNTAYLHLSGFGPGIRTGARVQAGDTIGYVGSSGGSTGPHLDYRVYLRGQPVNPLSQKFMPAEPLRREFLSKFKDEKKKMSIALSLPKLASRPIPIHIPF